MEVQQALRDLIDTVQLLQRKATLAERPLLRLTTELLELCASTEPQPCMVELLQVEVGQQKRWVMDYLNQQKGNEQMTRLADDFAKLAEDHERLLLRYCQETWEGARAIALVLDVPLLRPTWKVMHHREAFSYPKGRRSHRRTDNSSISMPSEGPREHY
ncbi:HAT family dimerization domain protein [Fusarium oxysporum f. sp. albedinis]|nr:HAT family dimerization domain protein [Fusarium oxysporum f. sp. albedinis]